MFDKVLIANRGEIAIRVVRSCRELGVRTVAVYSDFDRNAKHVRAADEAVHLGGNLPAESYLDFEKILDAAARTGAQAIHPGYGFLSENSGFVRACRDAGIVFIGPPAEAMDQMGDKVSARRAAVAAGVEPVPGTTDPVTSVDDVLAFAEQHGWPVAMKASHGGGGKGLRIAHDPASAAEGFEGAQREALSYFGNAEMYLERYLERPHHVEIQVLADMHGTALWLGDRDCSAQRRHQKLVEETPSPVVSDDLRHRMGEAAVAVSGSVGYTNAGTVECLVQDGEFWFLEMNTRLQVEHCVTEEVCGLDLVAAQLRIAAGEPLWFGQADVTRRGHAIEVRVNAEDAAAGFMPSPGRISRFEPPGGPGVRLDAGYGEGDEVSQFYDNLVAKLVVWGETHDQARRRMLRTIGEFEIEGVTTNLPAHRVILDHPDFVDGVVTTKWVESHLDLGTLAATAAPGGEGGADTDDQLVERRATVEVDGRRFDVKMWLPDAASGSGAAPTAAAPKRPRRGGGSAGQAGIPGAVATPMQGTVLKILVTEGQTVAPGEAVAVLEAMKMENNINATAAGTVTDIKVAAGDTVSAGQVLLVVE